MTIPMLSPGGDERTDGQLLAAAREGDQDAWAEMVCRFTPMVWRVARGFRLDEATSGDVVQSTWMALAEHVDAVRDPQAVRAWLASTARRLCLKELRTRQRVELREEFSEAEQGTPATSVDELAVASDRDRRLWRAFGRLPERDRVLLTLLMSSPALSYEEISRIARMPVGSIGPTRRRCLERLRRELARDGIDQWTYQAG